jgi:hypothetical protein
VPREIRHLPSTIYTHPTANLVPSLKTREKKFKCQKGSARGNFKAAPKQENASVLLRANDVGGVLMKLVTFAPLTSEVTTEDQPTSIRTIHWKRDKTVLFKNVEY